MSFFQKSGLLNKQVLLIDGVSLEIRYYPGQATKPTLIFLHEGLGCVELWRDFPKRVSELSGCPALVYSRQGYGRSQACEVPRPLSYMHTEGLDVLPELLKVAGIKEHIVIGHSDGGSIALIHAGGSPSAGLSAVITMAPHVFCEDLSVSAIEKTKQVFLDGDLREKLKKYHHDNIDCAFWGWNKAWLDPGFIYWTIEEYLPKIDVPQLVIQGKQDPYGTVAQVESIAKHCAGDVHIHMIDQCAHSPFIEKTLECLDTIVYFLENDCGV